MIKFKRFSFTEIREDVIRLLDKYMEDEHGLAEEIDGILQKEENGMLSELIKIITHLEFKKKDARKHWNNIIKHTKRLEESLNRKVGLRVAMLDYFRNIDLHLKNPKFIEIHDYNKTLEYIFVDPLTDLFNRRYLKEYLESEIKRSKRYKLVFSMLMMDIDNFKGYNDTYGHLAGDEALHKIASILRRESRGEDVTIRYGGEEFMLIMPQTDKNGAKVMAERLRIRIEASSFKFDEKWEKCTLTVSGGISGYPVDSQEPGELIGLADKALYRAKALGKNRIC